MATTQSEPLEKRRHFKLALVWAALGSLCLLAVFPFLLAAAPALLERITLPVPALIAVQTVQMGVLLIPLCWLGLRLGAGLGLDSPFARALVYGGKLPPLSWRGLAAALVAGIGAAVVVLALGIAFEPLMPGARKPLSGGIAVWKRLLASFYGGITEELLLRLFVLTTVAWLLWRTLLRGRPSPPAAAYGIAILVAAILFGAGHLPAAAAVWPLTAVVVLRTIVLNMIPGIPFGMIYCRWGLEYAMLAHFCADLVLQGSAGILEAAGVY
jgi:membrane protease YdiL (CAAX protease family)